MTYTLLGYYAACSGNCLPTFRNNLSVLSSRFTNLEGGTTYRTLKIGPIGFSQTSVKVITTRCVIAQRTGFLNEAVLNFATDNCILLFSSHTFIFVNVRGYFRISNALTSIFLCFADRAS